MSARVGTEAQSRSVATAVHPGVLSQVPAEITENSLQPAAADSHAGRHGIVVLPRRQSFVAATVAFGAACTSTSFSCSWRVAAGPAAARAATPSTTIAAIVEDHGWWPLGRGFDLHSEQGRAARTRPAAAHEAPHSPSFGRRPRATLRYYTKYGCIIVTRCQDTQSINVPT